jgi:serine/threonine protein kinase
MTQEYVILGPLSRGSEGFVFRIRDRKNQKEYALKVIWKDANKKGADAKIKNEISIHQSLRSQYIIQLLTKF